MKRLNERIAELFPPRKRPIISVIATQVGDADGAFHGLGGEVHVKLAIGGSRRGKLQRKAVALFSKI